MREQQVVLEDVPDRTRPRGRRRCSVAGASRTTPSRTIEPASIGSRPARARSSVVLPAPLGPRIATMSSSPAENAHSSSNAPTRAVERDVEAHTCPSQRSRSSASTTIDTASSTRLRAIAPSRSLCEQQVHRERNRLRPALDVAGERDRGAELPQRPGPAQRGARGDRRQDHRQRDPAEHRPALGAERRRRLLVAAVGRPQRGLDGDHEERHGHERLGEDRPGLRERQLDAEPVVEPAADEAVAAERQRAAPRRRRRAAAPAAAA